MQIPGQITYNRNRKGKIHGGIATSININDANECVKISEGRDSNEYIVTIHSQFLTPINVINVYSEQENRTAVNVIRDHWQELMEEIRKIENKGEQLILIGDFNKHIGSLIKVV